jgi:hypothetical protein
MVSGKGGNVLRHIGNTGIEAMAWAERMASLARAHSQAGSVLPAPAKDKILTKKQEEKERRAEASGPRLAGASVEKSPESIPRINTREIADKVYQLMQRDLIVERDRTTRLGV